jgi:hypothetical protein
MHHLFTTPKKLAAGIRIGEAACRDPLHVGVPVALPNDVTACPFDSQCHEVVLPQLAQK